MNLEQYIGETIISICNGIAEAKSKIPNGAIAPPSITDKDGNKRNVDEIRFFEFEVIISVNHENKIEVNSGLGMGYGIKAFFSGKYNKNMENKNVNKVCFSIPFLPEAILPKCSRGQGGTQERSDE